MNSTIKSQKVIGDQVFTHYQPLAGKTTIEITYTINKQLIFIMCSANSSVGSIFGCLTNGGVFSGVGSEYLSTSAANNKVTLTIPAWSGNIYFLSGQPFSVEY